MALSVVNITVCIGQGLHFCNYPFLFDAAAKSMLLQTDAMMQMQVRCHSVTVYIPVIVNEKGNPRHLL